MFIIIDREFPKLRMENFKGRKLNGPQRQQIVKDTDFMEIMTVPNIEASKNFALVVKNLLGNHNAPIYEELRKIY